MSQDSGQIPIGVPFKFAYGGPFHHKGRTFQVVGRKVIDPATPTVDIIVRCDDDGKPIVGAKRHRITMEFVKTV